MTDYCIVVANGARARLFSLEHPDRPEFESGPDLVEVATLAAPEHAARDRELYTDQVTGRNRRPTTGGHDYDEHRDDHDDEVEKRFARDIAAAMRAQGATHNVLCAEKRMLGFLRDALASGGGPAVSEVPRDLTGLDPRAVQARLAEDRLVPGRRPPGG